MITDLLDPGKGDIDIHESLSVSYIFCYSNLLSDNFEVIHEIKRIVQTAEAHTFTNDYIQSFVEMLQWLNTLVLKIV